MKEKLNILFLCTGNSCRSQMAEGWCNYFFKDRFNTYSAGIKKHGVNPYAVKVMREEGVDISKNCSNLVSEFLEIKMDLVVTVCDNARDSCPFFPGSKIIHHRFDDPPAFAKYVQEEKEVFNIYRRVRDEIKIFVKELEILVGELDENKA